MILGITGHQNLELFDEYWLRLKVSNFISMNNIHKGLSSLAIGADQLFARELRRKEIHYDVIIPCANYTSTFKTERDLDAFLNLLESSENSTILNFEGPSEEAFYTAGIQIIKQSSTIMAIWDGNKANGLGGTGDIVTEALAQNKPVYHINPVTQECKYLDND